ncbi:M23 family metallopeptidase [Halomonadaceae bacterium KBTZ08]
MSRLFWLFCLISVATSVMALELEGPRRQGALLSGQVEPGSEVRLNGDPVAITGSGRFALGFGRKASLKHELVVVAPDGERTTRTIELAEREYDVQRVDGVPQETVTPDEDALERIRAEARRVREARKTRSRRTDFTGPWVWPVAGPVTGVYGSQRFYNGEPRQPHYGIDIMAETGTPVAAPAGGRVVLVAPDLYFSGGTLILDHGYGVSSTFLHLSEIHVSQGDEVAQGDILGEVGASGRATGPHLDWRMNWRQQRVDPMTVAPPLVDGATTRPGMGNSNQ